MYIIVYNYYNYIFQAKLQQSYHKITPQKFKKYCTIITIFFIQKKKKQIKTMWYT